MSKQPEVDHLVAHQVGGRVVLKVYTPVVTVPKTRGECPDERPCPHVRCRASLYFVAGETRAGRRYDGRSPPSTLTGGWLEDPPAPSCALDVADAVAARGQVPRVEVIAKLLGLRMSQYRAIAAAAIEKLRAVRQLEEIDSEPDSP